MILDCPICKSRIKTRQDNISSGRYYFYCPSCDNELSFDYSGDSNQTITASVVQHGEINYNFDKALSGIIRNYNDTTQIIIPGKIKPVIKQPEPVIYKKNPEEIHVVNNQAVHEESKTGSKAQKPRKLKPVAFTRIFSFLFTLMYLTANVYIIFLHFQNNPGTGSEQEYQSALAARSEAYAVDADRFMRDITSEADSLLNKGAEFRKTNQHYAAKHCFNLAFIYYSLSKYFTYRNKEEKKDMISDQLKEFRLFYDNYTVIRAKTGAKRKQVPYEKTALAVIYRMHRQATALLMKNELILSKMKCDSLFRETELLIKND